MKKTTVNLACADVKLAYITTLSAFQIQGN